MDTPPPVPKSDALAVIRERLKKALVGLEPIFPNVDPWEFHGYKPDRSDFPIPSLVLFALGYVMGFKVSGPGEKVAWTVYGTFGGVPVTFEHRKFGFTISSPGGQALDTKRLEGQLRSALRKLEQWLEPYAKELVDAGEATIENRHSEFQSRYGFFRHKAQAAYAMVDNPKPKKKKKSKSISRKKLLEGLAKGLTEEMNRRMKHTQKGFFYSVAMVDAYFSYLEHVLVLLRVFTGQPFAKGEMLTLLAAKWDDKFKLLFDVTKDRKARAVLTGLKRLKERVRNPFAHGGVENDRGSIQILLPGIGPVPANFSKIKDSVRFGFVPIETDDHNSACKLFDEVDDLLKAGPLAKPMRMIDAGINPAFDPDSVAKYAEVTSGTDEELVAFIQWWSHEWERHANMDF